MNFLKSNLAFIIVKFYVFRAVQKTKMALNLMLKLLFSAWEGHDYKAIQFLPCLLLEQSDFVIMIAEVCRNSDAT